MPPVLVAPLAGLHNTAEKVTLAGYTLPKNTVVLTNYYALHLDPELWPEPRCFRPDRFLTPDGLMTSKLDNFMPFGLGKQSRDTIAMNMEIQLKTLLQQLTYF